MDTYTQAVLGAAVAHVVAGDRLRPAWLVGAAAAALPDADTLIRSASDPILRWEFHRHFTHAAVFTPVGAAVASLPWLIPHWGRGRWRLIYLAAFAGYASHAPLDLFTSYGTQFLWPFSDARWSLDAVSVVDPVFTLSLLLGLVLTVLLRSSRWTRYALVAASLYLGFGVWQNHRALAAQEQIAAARGHSIERGRAMPTIGNLAIWRSLYEYEGRFYSDAIRLGYLGGVGWKAGEDIPTASVESLPTAANASERLRRDFGRFAWFADDYVAAMTDDGLTFGDLRYSAHPERMEPLWGVVFAPGEPDAPVKRAWFGTDRSRALSDLREAVFAGTGFEPLVAPPR